MKPAAVNMGDRSERWRVPILLCIIGATVLFLLAPRRREDSGQSGWKFTFNSRVWKLNRNESRELYVTPSGVEVYYNRSYHLGPLFAYTFEVTNPKPLGTNAIRTGMFLFDQNKKQALGRVLAIEPEHRFPDGTVHEGVLMRSEKGVEAWVLKEDMGKVLVGR